MDTVMLTVMTMITITIMAVTTITTVTARGITMPMTPSTCTAMSMPTAQANASRS